MCWTFPIKSRKNDIVEYVDYQIPITHLKGPKEDGDMQAAKRDCNAPPTLLSQYMVMWPVYRPNFSNIKAVDTTILDGLWTLEWAWHPAETNLRCARSSGIFIRNPYFLAFVVSEISEFIQTDGLTDRGN